MLIQEQINQVTKIYPPDGVKTATPRDDEDNPHHWWLQYGRLTISVNVRDGSYSDNYHSTRKGHVWTCTSEVAIYDNTKLPSETWRTAYRAWVNPHAYRDPRYSFPRVEYEKLLDIVGVVHAYINN